MRRFEGDGSMNIVYKEAVKEDYEDLIRLRIGNMRENYKEVSEQAAECMEKHLTDYFDRKLGKELFVFTARDEGRLVGTAYLMVIEGPANVWSLNGLYGEVRGVYTLPEYRGKGICTRLMTDLVERGREIGLSSIQLDSTEQGYQIYKKVGFEDAEQEFAAMEIVF